MTIALAFVALMRVWFRPYGWIPGILLVVAWAALNALLLTRSVRRNIVSLQRSTAAIAEGPVVLPEQNFQDFDDLARAISIVSMHVERVLAKSAESRDELVAMIDSMQDAVVAVDQAGRIQWTNQQMQPLIPGHRLRARCGWGMRWCRRSATRTCCAACRRRWKSAR